MTAGEGIIALLEIEPKAGRAQALIDYYLQKGVIEAGRKYGLIEGVLTRVAAPHQKSESATQEVRLQVISLWPEAAAYQSWLDSPDRHGLVAGMNSLVDSIDGNTAAGTNLGGRVPNDNVIHRVDPTN